MFARKQLASDLVTADATAPANANPASVSGLLSDGTFDPEGLVVIGKSTHVSGKIGACRILDVHGILEADVVAQTVIVRDGGGLRGTVQTENAQIFGVVEGSLTVNEHLDIQSTGRVSGGVTYRTLSVATGAKFLGTLDTHAEAAPAALASAEILPPLTDSDLKGYVSNGALNGHSDTGAVNGSGNGLFYPSSAH